LWKNAPTAEQCLLVGRLSPESYRMKNLKATCRRVQKLNVSFKILQTSRLRRANLWAKFQILTVGTIFPHFCLDKGEISHWRANLWPAPPCQISPFFIRAMCRPCGAKKNIFGPWSKRNTGKHAALLAGLPVIHILLLFNHNFCDR